MINTGGYDGLSLGLSTDVDLAADILDFWFGENLKQSYKTKWFPSGVDMQNNADDLIRRKYSNVLNLALQGNLNHWISEKKSLIALIIVLDQFSRHIYRNIEGKDDDRKLADKLALSFSKGLIQEMGWDKDLNVQEFVFALMPLRHSPSIEHLSNVLTNIRARLVLQQDEFDLLVKFEKQTIRRLQELQDRRKVSP